MKWIKWLLIVVVVLALAAVAAVYFVLRAQAPVYNGELELEGLSAPVEVLYDEYGIPHIYAQNEEDLYMAFGYVHAQDRLFQMEMLRRVGGGRLAEILGPDLLPVDKLFRTLGINEAAEKAVEHFNANADKDWHKAAVAYQKGVNHFLMNGPTPIEYTLIGIEKEAFTPKDMYLISGYMAFSFAEALLTDPIATRINEELGPDYLASLSLNYSEHEMRVPLWPKQQPDSSISLSAHISDVIGKMPVPLLKGSNAFIVSGEKSQSGKPVLATETHIGYSQPGTWYEAHLECPGHSIYGYHIAGIPATLVGHDRTKAWGITMFENDDIDMYRETLHPDDHGKYLHGDRWLPVQERNEVIRVKDSSDVVLNIRSSMHGPFIDGIHENIHADANHPVAVSWTFTQLPNQLLSAFYSMGKAKNMNEFQIAVSRIHAPGLNIIYGDNTGNIAYWGAATLVKRPEHVNSMMFLNGASGKDDMLGYWPFSAAPKSINPPEGFIVSANGQPDTTTCGLYPGYYSPDHRGLTLSNALRKDQKWDVNAMKGLQLSVASTRDLEIAQLMMQEQANEQEESVRALIDILNSWDAEHSLESTGAAIYNEVLHCAMQGALLDELGEKDFKALKLTHFFKRSIITLMSDADSPWWDDVSTDQKETKQDILKAAFLSADSSLTAEMGKDRTAWQWGKVHKLVLKHPVGEKPPMDKLFNLGPYPIPGGNETVWQTGTSLGSREARFGSQMRIVVDMADPEHSWSVSPSGQSGNVMSPHYDDQVELYVGGGHRPELMDKGYIEQQGGDRLTIVPAGAGGQ